MRRLQSDDGNLEHGVGANLSLCCRPSEIADPRIGRLSWRPFSFRMSPVVNFRKRRDDRLESVKRSKADMGQALISMVLAGRFA
jgi:hypothetical protein